MAKFSTRSTAILLVAACPFAPNVPVESMAKYRSTPASQLVTSARREKQTKNQAQTSKQATREWTMMMVPSFHFQVAQKVSSYRTAC